MARVYVGASTPAVAEQLRKAMEWIRWEAVIPPGARVFIKPNFTFPFFKPGVTTSPGVLEALIALVKTRTAEVTVGESDGGANAWPAEEAFAGHDLPRIASRHGVKLVNLSRAETETVTVPLRGGPLALPFPRLLLRDTDVFISVPVPKIHCMTKVSLGLKNQWGCIPCAPRRFCYHHRFDELVCQVNRLCRTRLVVGDCTCMLTGNGPMFGEQLQTDMLVASDDLGAFEVTMLHLMGLEHWRVRHLDEARRMGLSPAGLEDVELTPDWKRFRSDRFFLKRTLQNYVALLGFRSRFVTWLGYESPLAGPLHAVLYALKGNPLREAMLESGRGPT